MHKCIQNKWLKSCNTHSKKTKQNCTASASRWHLAICWSLSVSLEKWHSKYESVFIFSVCRWAPLDVCMSMQKCVQFCFASTFCRWWFIWFNRIFHSEVAMQTKMQCESQVNMSVYTFCVLFCLLSCCYSVAYYGLRVHVLYVQSILFFFHHFNNNALFIRLIQVWQWSRRKESGIFVFLLQSSNGKRIDSLFSLTALLIRTCTHNVVQMHLFLFASHWWKWREKKKNVDKKKKKYWKETEWTFSSQFHWMWCTRLHGSTCKVMRTKKMGKKTKSNVNNNTFTRTQFYIKTILNHY